MKPDEVHASMLEKAASRMMVQGPSKPRQTKAERKMQLQNSILLEARSIDSMIGDEQDYSKGAADR